MGKGMYVSWIPGIMLGFEWDYENGFVAIDLLIIRIVIDYVGFIPDDHPL